MTQSSIILVKCVSCGQDIGRNERTIDMGGYGYYCGDCFKCSKCGKELTKEEANVLPDKNLICSDCLSKLRTKEKESLASKLAAGSVENTLGATLPLEAGELLKAIHPAERYPHSDSRIYTEGRLVLTDRRLMYTLVKTVDRTHSQAGAARAAARIIGAVRPDTKEGPLFGDGKTECFEIPLQVISAVEIGEGEEGSCLKIHTPGQVQYVWPMSCDHEVLVKAVAILRNARVEDMSQPEPKPGLARVKPSSLKSPGEGPAHDTAAQICPYCGEEIQPDDEFCPACGVRNLAKPLADSPPPAIDVGSTLDERLARPVTGGIRRQASLPPKWKYCPECGCKLPYQSAKFCPECGFEFSSKLA
jgi:uncharacterized Zn ribbon protein